MPLNLRPASMLVGAALALCSCNLNKFTADTTSNMLITGSASMDREADIEFARYAFPASLKTIETFLISSPDNANLLLLLARGYNSYAFGILEGDLEKAKVDGPDEEIEELTNRAVLHYLRGREYGFRLLSVKEVEQAAKADDMDKLEQALAVVKKNDAPALFWAGYGWASAVNLAQEDADMVGSLPVIEKIMARAYELDRDYNDGAPIIFHGVYHASKPQIAGGKPEVAKKYFDEAMKTHGDNLLVPYLYARFYCARTQNRKLFDELMAKVASADVTAHPELRLNNEIARDRARFWSHHVDELIAEG